MVQCGVKEKTLLFPLCTFLYGSISMDVHSYINILYFFLLNTIDLYVYFCTPCEKNKKP